MLATPDSRWGMPEIDWTITPFPSEREGIRDFQTKEGREKRRALSKGFRSD